MSTSRHRRQPSKVAAVAVITSAGIAVPSAVVATQAIWSGAAYATPCAHKYARVNERENTSLELKGIATVMGNPPWQVSSPSKSFLDQEQWVITNWSKASNPASHDTHVTWVEDGLTIGIFSRTPHSLFPYSGAFWADSRGAFGYANHILSAISYPANASSWYQFKITEHSGTQQDWNITAKIYTHSEHVKATETAESMYDPHTETANWAYEGIEDYCYPHANTYVHLTGQTISVESALSAWGKASHYSYSTRSKGAGMHVKWETGKTGSKFSVSVPT